MLPDGVLDDLKLSFKSSKTPASSKSFAHHQEQLTVFTVSGSIHPSYCRQK